MRLGTAIERLVDNYRCASDKDWIMDKVAWALYQTWKEADRKTEPRKEQNFCGKCRYLYRDFKYGLSCYRLMDNEPCKYEERKDEPNSSEFPNNCEHITEDGVTCAKYPACDDCPDNPLNKVKGSKRLLKGSEQTDCQTCKWWSSYGYCVHRECKGYAPQTERSSE